MGVGVGDGARKATGERGKGRGRVEEEGGSEGLHNIVLQTTAKCALDATFIFKLVHLPLEASPCCSPLQ